MKKVKYFLYVLIFLIIIGIPLIINEAYKANTGYRTLWGAEDALILYGTMLGAMATVLAVWMSIKHSIKNQEDERKHSIKNQEDERRLSVKPYLATTRKFCSVEDFLGAKIENCEYIMISCSPQEPIGSTNKIPDSITYLKLEPAGVHAGVSEWPVYHEATYLMKVYMQNIGAGNAVDMTVDINSHKLENFYVTLDEKRALNFILDFKLFEQDFFINLKYKYWDVASTAQYEQSEIIEFARFEDFGIVQRQVGQDNDLTRPKQIAP